MMREKAVVFGPHRTLVGVWTEARDPANSIDVPAVIILNSGLVPHTGIWRLHVRLARALATIGVPSLRFDLSGIGDSEPPRDALPLEQIVRRDIDAAATYAREAQGIGRLVTLGLCSGARDALATAGRRDDVSGLVAIDLVADLRTWQFKAVDIGGRLLNLESWTNTLTGRNRRMESLVRMVTGGEAAPADDREPTEVAAGVRTMLTRDDLASQLAPLVDRGTRLLFLYSAGLEENYNHRAQFEEALPDLAKAPEVEVDFFPKANHTFEEPAQQRALIARITRWCAEAFGTSD